MHLTNLGNTMPLQTEQEPTLHPNLDLNVYVVT